jgi:hypothetical protein
MLKTVSSITNAIGALNYKGTWNASTNNPTLVDGTGAKGDYYVVSTSGTQTFGGVQLFFGPGDWIVYNGAVWQRVEGGSDGNFANVTLTSTDAGAAAAPLLELYRDSATPAASDTLGEIEFNGEDSAGNKQAYALFHGSILSPTSGAEQGQLHFETATGGALTEKMIIGTTNLVINEIGGIFNVRIEGDTDANLFYTDATNSRVGVGTSSPAHKLDVVGTVGISSTTTLSGLTASTALALNASKEIVSVTNTGTGNNVLATSPTLTTPVIGAATGTSLVTTDQVTSQKTATTTKIQSVGFQSYFLPPPSTTFTITPASGLAWAFVISEGNGGGGALIFCSYKNTTINIVSSSVGTRSFVASNAPAALELGIYKSADSSVISFVTGATWGAAVAVCLLGDYLSAVTDPV